ncbi:MAG TPA: hemolysin III family protein [Acidimicrobiales bacterium]|nr:hemolysin III family protein [Acidimicrobiales bacterium]
MLTDDPQPTSPLALPGSGDDIGSVLDAAPGVQPLDEPPRPLLRGWFHLVAFAVSLPAGVVVVASATSTRARLAAVVYAIAVSALFGVSSTYHLRVWTAEGRRRMRRVDHGAIYVMIAGCYTPVCLLAVRGSTGQGLLVAAWVGAAIGLGFAITGMAEKPVFGLACYIGLGWILVVALPDLTRQLGPANFALLMTGGLAYTVGGVVLGTNRPNPYPRIFGYHEVWHVLVVVASACHYLAIRSVVQAAG